VHHNSIIYNKPTRRNSGSIVSRSVRTVLHIYTGFIPSQLITNTSGCCYSL